MWVPTTFHAALLMTVLSTVCWGSFANTFKVTKNYRFELYYWDYGVGIFVISVVLAFTMGSYAGGTTAFLANLHAADGINLFYAALGGFIFNIANTLLVAGIEIVGLAIAFPVSIGIALVEGVVLSYALATARESAAAGGGDRDGGGGAGAGGQGVRRAADGRSGFATGRDRLRDFRVADGNFCAVCDAGDDARGDADAIYDSGFPDARGVRVLVLLQHDPDAEADYRDSGSDGRVFSIAGFVSRAGVAGRGDLGLRDGV